MKAVIFGAWFPVAMVAAGWLAAGSLLAAAAGTNDQTAPVQASAPASAETVQLSYGVPEIVKLTQAQISDDTIITYIKTSGNSYGLDAGQIIYLRQQGVSETVINTMLSQPKPGTLTSASAAPLVGAASDVSPAAMPPVEANVTASPAPVAPASSVSVYVMPYTTTYPYYYPSYCGVAYAPMGFSIGIGSRWGGGYRGFYRGGYRNGWHH